jgi:hypothetical protein
MTLHCAATLVLVPVGTTPDAVAGTGALLAGPLEPGTDVVAELQSLADLHRGERVVVPVAPDQIAAALDHLGRRPSSSADGEPVLLEIGDDGWALLRPPG